MIRSRSLSLAASVSVAFALLAACGGDDEGGGGSGGAAGASGSGAAGGSGGTSSGGTAGSSSGGSGGSTTGGSGGSTTGGSGGSTTGGSGGAAGSGGASGGAAGSGGASGGTAGTGGSGGAAGAGGSGGSTGGTGGTGGGSSALNCTAASGSAPALKLTEVASVSGALCAEAPTGDTARLFVCGQTGVIRLIKNGQLATTPFLNIASIVTSGGERGLLGLAFHPNYASNGKFYVHYSSKGTTNPTTAAGDTIIAEYTRSTGNPDVADPNSGKIIFTTAQPYANHNGGGIHFRNDGKLYIGLGDGGSGGDPQNNGQSLNKLLGKMLRIDVDAPAGGKAYGIPSGNMTGSNVAPEIWSYGLRNPWRWHFDPCTWDMYIGDVGQNAWEEIDVEPASKGSGTNWGWKVMEGTHCYNAGTCDQSGKTLPVAEYSHSQGCSVTGGVVYRGSAIPGLRGTYLYADYCSGRFWSFKWSGSAVTPTDISSDINPGYSVKSITSFGHDASGEAYVTAGGKVYRVDAK